jgi:hypothetical protein
MMNPDSNAKQTFPRVKTPAALPEPLTQGLNAYAIAAAAAGVAVLACALPAEAAPICRTLSNQLFLTSTFPLNPADQAAPALQHRAKRNLHLHLGHRHQPALLLEPRLLHSKFGRSKDNPGRQEPPCRRSFRSRDRAQPTVRKTSVVRDAVHVWQRTPLYPFSGWRHQAPSPRQS